ncbi:MAG: sensor domain-containing diguanylate cyclase [Spirochaetales bacterium]|nr:sensor domain-containing diguanylate cyclase [Spirochaetales bacterium]
MNILRDERTERQREQVVQKSLAIQSALSNEIYSAANLVLGLLATVSIHPDLSQKEFELIAKIIFRKSDVVSSITMAPNNIISYVYPLEGHEEKLGFNFMEHPSHRLEVLKAVSNPNGALSGPVIQPDGTEVFISRVPIYQGEGGYNYWGMASIIIDKKSLLQKARIHDSDLWLKIAIKSQDERGLDGGMIEGNKEVFDDSPILTTIQLSSGSWIMAAAPIQGWSPPMGKWDFIIWLIGIILGVIISILLLHLLSSHRKMKRLALRDPLTGLANRRLFHILAERQIMQAERTNINLFMLYLDLDNFKKINDRHGHKTGDIVLQQFVKSISANIRKTDIFARMGGDEFVLLPCRLATDENIEHLCEKIIKLSNSVSVELNLDVDLGCSIGISRFPIDGADDEQLLKASDKAMYESKNKGKNVFSYYLK